MWYFEYLICLLSCSKVTFKFVLGWPLIIGPKITVWSGICVPSRNFHMTNRILAYHGISLWCVSGLSRAPLERPVLALLELDAPLHQRVLRVRPGELERDVATLVSISYCRFIRFVECKHALLTVIIKDTFPLNHLIYRLSCEINVSKWKVLNLHYDLAGQILHLSHLHICGIIILLLIGFLSTGGVFKVVLLRDAVFIDSRRFQADHDAVLVLAQHLQHSRFFGSEIRKVGAQVRCFNEIYLRLHMTSMQGSSQKVKGYCVDLVLLSGRGSKKHTSYVHGAQIDQHNIPTQISEKADIWTSILPGRHPQVDELRPGALLLADHGGHLVCNGLAGH